VLLVHEPRLDPDTGALVGQVPQQERHSAAALEADLQANPALPKLRVLVDRQLSRDELEPLPDHPYPLLRARFRWQDRPGAFLNVLNSISDTLSEELPSLKGRDYWSVSYARVQVVTGQVALGRLTIRMHIPAEKIASWTTSTMEEMGRRIEERAADEAERREAVGLAGDELSKPEEPVIGIDRMTRPAG
jgi:hypothetical protein